jgi:hypothetical protein
MKLINLFLIGLIAVLLLIPMASATGADYIRAQRLATMKVYPLVPLGIENIPGITLEKTVLFYNFISIGFLFLLGAMSSKRMTRFFAILIPTFAGIFVYFQWLTSPNPIQTYGVIIMCAIIGAAVYMKGSLRENFGGGGPGSLIMNIAFYIIVLEACVGLINSTGVWEDSGKFMNSASNMSNEWIPNADLSESIPLTSDSGGLYNQAIGVASLIGQLTLSSLMLFINILGSLLLFSATLAHIFPFITTSPLGLAILGTIQLGIWFIYVIFIYQLFGKPFPDTVAF